jgi:hypothetical protein
MIGENKSVHLVCMLGISGNLYPIIRNKAICPISKGLCCPKWYFVTDVLGHHIGLKFKCLLNTRLALEDGKIDRSETSSWNFLYSLLNNPQQRSSHPLPDTSPISCMYYREFFKINTQYRSETYTFIFLILNTFCAVSLYGTSGYVKEIYWECLGKMCADLGKQTVTGWCETLGNRKLSRSVDHTWEHETPTMKTYAGICLQKKRNRL